ncbi:LysE family transporter [Candidatus Latescibacterota bacterium]
MSFIFFLFQVVIISLSGVMAPGPITAVTIGVGTKSPHAGALVAVGHGIVEFPLMFMMFLGLGYIFDSPYVKMGIFILGGIFLLFIGAGMLRSMKKTKEISENSSKLPIISGIMLSAGNAFFIIWWATIGASLISKAVAFGLTGFLIFAVVHWLCDFSWYYILSTVSFRGRKILGMKFQRSVFGISGTFLLFFGVLFIRDGFKLWLG